MHSLLTQVRTVAVRARQIVVARAVARVVAVTLAAFLVAALGDYCWRYRERLPRSLSLGAVVIVAGWGIRRWLLPAAQYRLSETEAAQRIEVYFPILRGKLASAVEFLTKHSAAGASQSLMASSIHHAHESARLLNLRECLESSTLRRSLSWLAAVFGTAGLFAYFDPSGSLQAARRLVLPWNAAPWPQRHRLAFYNWRDRIAVGQDFEIEIGDVNGRLPVALTVQVRNVETEEVEQHVLRAVESRVVDRWEGRTETFEIRAFGGDDDSMEWRRIEVSDPPRLAQFACHIYPPEYSGLMPRTVTGGATVLAGSQAEVTGKSASRLSRAEIISRNSSLELPPLELSADRQSFRSVPKSWMLDTLGHFRIELEDDSGVVARAAAEGDFQVLGDSAPRVVWEISSASPVVTPDGYLPIQLVARDDLALQLVKLKIHVARSKPKQSSNQSLEAKKADTYEVTLYQGPSKPQIADFPRVDGGDVVRIDTKLELAETDQFEQGDQLELVVVATDYQPRPSESNPVTVRVVSRDAIAEQYTRQQFGLLAKLEEVIKLQRETSRRTVPLVEQIVAQQSTRTVTDEAKGIQYSQRRIRQLAIENRDSAHNQITTLMQEYSRNQLDRSSNSARLRELAARLDGLNRHQLTAVESDLDRLIRALSGPSVDFVAAKSALADASNYQQELLSEFETMLATLVEWESAQRLASESQRIENTQETITTATERLLEQGDAFRSKEEFVPQEKDAFNNLARQQFDNSRDVERLLNRIRQMLRSAAQQDPVSAKSLNDALQVAEQTGVVAAARASATDIERHRIGETLQHQQRLQAGLQALSSALSQKPERDLERVAAYLREANSQLNGIRSKQDQLMTQWKDKANTEISSQDLQRISQDQRDIAAEIGRLRSELNRMPARQTAASLGQAAAAASQSADAAAAANASQSEQLAERTDQALQDAQAKLRSELEVAEQLQLQRKVARLQQLAADWLTRQMTLNDETLKAAQENSDPSSRPRENNEICQNQRQLGLEVELAANKDYKDHVFAVALESTSAAMLSATEHMESDRWESASFDQMEAAQQLRMLAESLSPENEADDRKTEEDKSKVDDKRPNRKPRSIAELRLLRTLQMQIQRRTREIDRARPNWSAGERVKHEQELQRLAEQQTRLADRVMQMVQSESEESAKETENDRQ